MPDKFTEVTSKSWGGNIMDSIKGITFGLILFLGSFVVLWINEGRQDMSEAAKLCQPISPEVFQKDAEGKPVCVSAYLKTEEKLGDPEFIQPGDYITLSRHIEMFAWVENRTSEERKKIGGGTETVTTYTYEKKWTSSPSGTSDFRYPEGHENPTLTIMDKNFVVQSAMVGVYSVAPDRLSLPAESPLDLKQRMLATAQQPQGGAEKTVRRTATGGDVITESSRFIEKTPVAPTRLEGGYICIGRGSLQNPQVGDIRINYTALQNNIYVTVFGKLQGDRIVPYMFEGKHRLYRAFTAERDEAIAQLHTEFKTVGWILRAVGFIMMWIGLTMFFGPINAVLDVLPVLGSVGRGIVSFVMFFVALILSAVTIIVSMIAHNVVALLVTLGILLMITVFLIMRAKKKKTPAAP